MMEMTLNSYYTLVIAVITLLIGRQLVQRIQLLNRFNIPEPVAGGLLGSLLLLTAYILFDFTVRFDSDLQTAFMLVFFASLGLSASLGKLKAGGSPLVKFLIIIIVFLVLQNFISLGLGYFLGLDPFLSLVAGSISLMGGHGTAAAWGNVLETDYGIQGAIALGMACATFGLVIGGIVGSPLANRLIKKNNLSSSESIDSLENRDIAAFEVNRQVKLITASNAVETLALFAICLAFADFMTVFARGTWFELPTFVWALMAGVVVRNILESIFKVNMFERSIDVFGNAALSMFLVMALLSLRLWEIADLAAPLIILLTLQTIFMIIYIWFITFRFMGKDYDAAVLSAGHGGFGTGATPTAIANMQSITDRYGPSYKAFLIVPIVGAFFIDIVNAAMIQITLKVLSTFI